MSGRSVASSPSAARPSSPSSGQSVAAASTTARSLVTPHAEDVLSLTSGSAGSTSRPSRTPEDLSIAASSRDKDGRRRFVNSETRSTGTLFVILVAFLLSSITATMVLSNHSYNFTAAPHWVMVGGLTSSSATFRVRNARRLVVTLQDPVVSVLENPEVVVFDTLLNTTEAVSQGTLAEALVTNLQPNTQYFYATFSSELSRTPLDSGRFVTAPDESGGNGGGAASTLSPGGFKFATAGCAWTGSAAKVFQEIAEEPDLLFLLHMGDFHYEDLVTTSIDERILAYDKVMASPTQRQLLNQVGLAYMYDDHDYLDNNSGRNTASPQERLTALQGYRLGIPHYPLAAAQTAVTSNTTAMRRGNYQAFTIGTVRFLLTDLRSEATLTAMYSNEQRDWLLAELAQAASYDFVILISTKPWIGPVESGEDNWMGHPEDRRLLSSFISENLASTQNLLMISSDAHMLAFDDGSNTYYGNAEDNVITRGVPSFPILMSGPLDRLGSAKGGPFTEGCHTVDYERNHQYAIVEYQPRQDGSNGEPCLSITAYSIDFFGSKSIVFSKRLCGQIFQPSDPGVGSCSSSLLTDNTQAVIGLALALLFTVVLLETCLLGNTWLHRICLFGMVVVIFLLTCMVGIVIPISALGIKQFDTFPIAMIALFQIISVSFYLAFRVCKERCGANRRRK